ncbi:MAG: metallophosphoesterase [Candidatus Aminicenantes bacterium]|nr:metallophosphoesterase [Candidatus Aminicenantes bacterium]
MRIAIISDIHLGDPMSVMAARKGDPVNGPIELGVGYKEFKEKVEKKFKKKVIGKSGDYWLDHLVLLGDILDFSISSYENSYAVGKRFFQQLKDDGIADQIIYMPGNHDCDLWHTVEYQVNVINKVEKGELPKPFRMSVTGIIEGRKDMEKTENAFTLFKVTPRKNNEPHMYGGLFLDKITNPTTCFNFAYPNLYLVTDSDTILITHGQYLDMYWSVLGKWVFKVINGDLDLKDPNGLNLKEMVGINFPLNQLACSGVGQAAPLTEVIQNLEHDVNNKNVKNITKYLKNLWAELKKVVLFKHFIVWLILRCPLAKWWLKSEIIESVGKMTSSRYDEEFLEHQEVRDRFVEFYNSSIAEIDEINQAKVYKKDIPAPTKMIFGHTHEPISWGDPKAPAIILAQLPNEKQPFRMYNSGGWLNKIGKDGKLEFCGAEIFFYETQEGISSVRVECK